MGGCCGTESAVPENIIPDPTGPGRFYIKAVSWVSSDYEVWKDKDMENEKWLVIDKQGGLFADKCNYVLENYVRDPDEGIGSGQALCSVKVDQCSGDNFDFYSHDFDADITVDGDSDPSEYSESDVSDVEPEEEAKIKIKQKCKFRFKTKAKIFRDRGQNEQIGELKVKAKGKCKRKNTRHFGEREVEGGHQKFDDRTHEQEIKVKKFLYKLTINDEEIPIELCGSFNRGEKGLKWESPLFDTQVNGFVRSYPEVETKGDNPAMELLLGFLMTTLSPEDVKDSCHPNFQSEHQLFGAREC